MLISRDGMLPPSLCNLIYISCNLFKVTITKGGRDSCIQLEQLINISDSHDGCDRSRWLHSTQWGFGEDE